ncbi:MAG: sensor histidine kinase [Muribaculaceae bacterium]
MNKEQSSIDIIKSLTPQDTRTKGIRIITHIIVLAIIFVLPEVIMSWGRGVPRIAYLHTLVYVTIFYLNYTLLIERLLFRQRAWIFVGINVALVVLFGVLMVVLHDFFFPVPPEMRMGNSVIHDVNLHDKLAGFVVRDCLMVVLSACLSVALKLSEKWMRWRVLEKQIEAEKKEHELKNLKNQLNPHFLFNTLNNIYALIGISTDKAQRAVHELSQLLRYVLYDNEQNEVPLERDLLFVKNYIALMRLRLTPMVTLTVQINENDGCGLKIAPLMFVSLVENAFKHGVSASEPSSISIAIGVEGGCTVHCHVENSCTHRKPESDKSSGGIGIANLRRQLSIIYPGKHELHTEMLGDKYVADLKINLKETN